MLRVTARAPTRIDLAGGTLDLWPIHHLLDHKATVNVGVTLDAHVEVASGGGRIFRIISQDQAKDITGDLREVSATRELPLIGMLLGAIWRDDLPALTITTAAKSPAGAGLGGSSCLGICIAAALLAARKQLGGDPLLDEASLVRLVQDVEARLISAPTGCQDYWGAVRGRVNLLTYPYGNTAVETLLPSALPGLADELILCFSGQSRASAINNWEIFKRLFDGDRALLATFNNIGSAAEQCRQAALRGDLTQMLRWSEHEWELRKQLWPDIETQTTRRLDQAARSAGARFSRVCGAGGGGVMAVFAPKDKHASVVRALVDHGGAVLAAGIAETGLVVETAS